METPNFFLPLVGFQAFPLSEHTKQLLQYIESTFMLPISHIDYLREVLVNDDKLQSTITQLIEVYGGMRDNCTNFVNHTQLEAVKFAARICAYSENATVHYKSIHSKFMSLLDGPRGPEFKQDLNKLISVQVQKATDIRNDAQVVSNHFLQFLQDTKADITNLEREDKALAGSLRAYNAQMDNHNNTITELDKVIKNADTKRYHDKLFFAQKKLEMDQAQKKLRDTAEKITVVERMRATCNGCLTDLREIKSKAGLTVDVIHPMLSGFSDIVSSMQLIMARVNENTYVIPWIVDVNIDEVVLTWDNLGKSANQYIQEAFISGAYIPAQP